MRAFHLDPDDDRPLYDRMVAGQWYRGGDERTRAESRACLAAMARFEAEYPHDPEGAQQILRENLGGFGEDAHVRPPLVLDYGTHLFIGPQTFVNANLTALDVVDIRIGAHCQLGPNIQLLAPIHPLEPGPRAEGWEAAEPITIEGNVWIGGGVIVCPGVRIGRDSVIGAGSVVTRDVPAGVLAVGNPARVVRELPVDPTGGHPAT